MIELLTALLAGLTVTLLIGTVMAALILVVVPFALLPLGPSAIDWWFNLINEVAGPSDVVDTFEYAFWSLME